MHDGKLVDFMTALQEMQRVRDHCVLFDFGYVNMKTQLNKYLWKNTTIPFLSKGFSIISYNKCSLVFRNILSKSVTVQYESGERGSTETYRTLS